MADQHYGYPGSVNAAAWASLAPNVGAAQYSVGGVNDCKVVTSAHADRGIEIKPGTITGDGVMDKFESSTFLAHSAVASGADRWDMVVLRRTWNPTPGASTYVFTIITGGTNKSLPARNNTKGTLADQPIALCRIKAGSSVVQEIIDLRVWAHNGGAAANDDLVMTYLNDPGTVISIGTTANDRVEWHREVDKDGNVYWRPANTPLYGSGASLFGASPAPNNSALLMQAGSIVHSSDASGYARITWPKPFPNGLLTVVATNGDDWALSMGGLTVAGSGNPVFGTEAIGNKTSWVYVIHGYATGYNDGPLIRKANLWHRINWIAIGW